MDEDKRSIFHKGYEKGFPKKSDDAPNAFNNNEMSKDVLMPRVPEGATPAGEPRKREPR